MFSSNSNGKNYFIPNITSLPEENYDNLCSSYDSIKKDIRAKKLSVSKGTRYTIFLLPGIYKKGKASKRLLVDCDFIDFIGISNNQSDTVIINGTDDELFITSEKTNVKFSNFTVVGSKNFSAGAFKNSSFENITIKNASGAVEFCNGVEVANCIMKNIEVEVNDQKLELFSKTNFNNFSLDTLKISGGIIDSSDIFIVNKGFHVNIKNILVELSDSTRQSDFRMFHKCSDFNISNSRIFLFSISKAIIANSSTINMNSTFIQVDNTDLSLFNVNIKSKIKGVEINGDTSKLFLFNDTKESSLKDIEVNLLKSTISAFSKCQMSRFGQIFIKSDGNIEAFNDNNYSKIDDIKIYGKKATVGNNSNLCEVLSVDVSCSSDIEFFLSANSNFRDIDITSSVTITAFGRELCNNTVDGCRLTADKDISAFGVYESSGSYKNCTIKTPAVFTGFGSCLVSGKYSDIEIDAAKDFGMGGLTKEECEKYIGKTLPNSEVGFRGECFNVKKSGSIIVPFYGILRNCFFDAKKKYINNISDIRSGAIISHTLLLNPKEKSFSTTISEEVTCIIGFSIYRGALPQNVTI